MKLLTVSNVYPPHVVGGAELVAHAWAKAYLDRGFTVKSFSGYQLGDREPYSQFVDECEGIEVQRITLPDSAWYFGTQTAEHDSVTRSFGDLLRSFRPEIVHFHNLNGLDTALIAMAKQGGALTIVTLHDHWGFCHWNTALRPTGEPCPNFHACAACLGLPPVPELTPGSVRDYDVRRRFHLGLTDLLVSPSESLRNHYVTAGYPAQKFRVVPYGVDYARFAESRSRKRNGRRPLKFLFLGSLGRHKGANLICQAFADPGLRDVATVDLFGEGELAAELRAWVANAGLKDVVRFRGYVPNADVPGLLCKFDALINASIWPENAPVSISEAMSAGLPVIAADIGGNREMIVRSGGGLLFRASDARDLARSCRLLADNPADYAAMRESATAYDAENSVGRRVSEVLHHLGVAI